MLGARCSAPGPPLRTLRRRHLYASTQPSIEQRMDSWDNYRELFSGAGCGLVGSAAQLLVVAQDGSARGDCSMPHSRMFSRPRPPCARVPRSHPEQQHEHGAAQPVAVGHGGRVCVPVPVLLAVPVRLHSLGAVCRARHFCRRLSRSAAAMFAQPHLHAHITTRAGSKRCGTRCARGLSARPAGAPLQGRCAERGAAPPAADALMPRSHTPAHSNRSSNERAAARPLAGAMNCSPLHAGHTHIAAPNPSLALPDHCMARGGDPPPCQLVHPVMHTPHNPHLPNSRCYRPPAPSAPGASWRASLRMRWS